MTIVVTADFLFSSNTEEKFQYSALKFGTATSFRIVIRTKLFASKLLDMCCPKYQ
jgi:hypothetical protein